MRAPALLGPPTSASFEAIGTTCQVLVTDPDALPEATRIVLGHLDVLDRAVSRFRDDSELARLAAAAITGPVTATVSSTTLEYAAAALRAAEHTGGLVDPTVGPALAATGYDDDLTAVQSRRSAEGSWRSGPDRVADRQWEGRGPGEGLWRSGPDRVADRQWEGRGP
ncbi:FAD:protein FMN transferase, partial [Nostocoides japonicum]|uniref:FAD:protein FMN transferase n=1 Tax=Nostocoides japonicum TaxID=99481 RepID=UPI00065B6EBB